MNLVIVESPAKAKTINKYLGDNYKVLASYGHIRDLPSKNGSVDPDQNFKMEWEVDSFSKKYLKEITDAAKESTKIILATDPDREGEAIAWHVKEYLDQKKLLKDKEVERVVFNEITKKAVVHGIENPRQIEPHLVDAYMTRRALDYLVGFNISPILWTKLPGSKSAGRVQSVALKLITEREHEIESFNPEEFWTLSVKFSDKNNNFITASIYELNSKKIEKFTFKNKVEINSAIEEMKNKKFSITDISSKTINRKPSGPFTTSTLQQTASSRLGFGASRTMQIAQKLYQGIEIEGETIGLITYMRTDGTNLSVDAINTFRDYIKENNIKANTTRDVANIISKIRSKALPNPNIINNVGSFFKNPIVAIDSINFTSQSKEELIIWNYDQDHVKVGAARLIELIKNKISIHKNVSLFKNHSLVLITNGQATQEDVLNYASEIQDLVYKTFNIKLEIEPNIIF